MSSKEAAAPALEPLVSDLMIGESPRWHAGRLWLADWGMRQIIAVDADGRSEVVVEDLPSFPFSLDWLPDGHLVIICERTLLRREGDGSLVAHAELVGISDYGWNEIVVDGRGNIYLNNCDFDAMAGEAPKPGFIGLVTPGGQARRVGDGVIFPNGMAITADNSTLIVAESYGKRLTAYDIADDGRLSNRRVWADLGDGVPDGICCDAKGAVWYADVPHKRCVRVSEGGTVLQTIHLDRGCFACMLGGPARRTLHIVAAEWRGLTNMFDEPRTGQVVTAEVEVPAAGWP